jgi:hypothetical protein
VAYTQADLDALELAIKSGKRAVQFGDRSATFHSLDELLKLRSIMQSEVAVTSGNATPRCSFGTFSKD